MVDPRKFGINPDSEIPVVLSYNMVHYESMHPLTTTDNEKTVILVTDYLEGKIQIWKTRSTIITWN